MSRKLLSVSASAALLGGTAFADVPSVAVDIAPIHSLVARVMAGVGEPNLIVQPGASPHDYQMRPSDAAALQEADVVFWIGEDLTPQLEDAIETLATNASVTELLGADGITLLDFRESALFEAHDHGDHEGHHDEEHASAEHADHDHDDKEHAQEASLTDKDHDDHDHDHDEDHASDDHGDHDHGEEDHAEHDHDKHDHDKEETAALDDHDHDHDHEHGEDHAGHDDHAHGAHDPHAWLSPANAGVWLNMIASQLSIADPDNAGTYFANATEARAEMDALVAEVKSTLEPVRGLSFIVFHDAYQYFENDFDFPAAGAISIGDASDPSPARIAEIQGRIANEGVDCVLSEPQFNPGLVATVLDGTEASTSVIDPLGAALEPGATLYPTLIRNMAQTLAGCR